MSVPLLGVAMLLLAVERVSYIAIWRAPDTFGRLCVHPMVAALGEPVQVVRTLFYAFKVLQAGVFVAWCYVHGDGTLWPPDGGVMPMAVGGSLMAMGQVLNLGVFYRLGNNGVFYGSRFGHSIPWCREFPFTLFEHPQYVGAVLSIWGFFVLMRFPHDDWFVLPLIETAYYYVGGLLEG